MAVFDRMTLKFLASLSRKSKIIDINYYISTLDCSKISQPRGFGVLGFWGFGGLFYTLSILGTILVVC